MANKSVTNPCSGGGKKPEGVVIPLGSKSVAQCSDCNQTITVNKANGLFRRHNGAFEVQPVVQQDGGLVDHALVDTTSGAAAAVAEGAAAV